jgi:proteasome lid subunit RPN8/RPN11
VVVDGPEADDAAEGSKERSPDTGDAPSSHSTDSSHSETDNPVVDPNVAAILDAADRGDAHDSPPSVEAELSEKRAEPRDLRDSITVKPMVDEAGKKESPAGIDPDHVEFQSIIRQRVVEQIREHAESNSGIEVCGVLVGTVYENPQASFVYIDGMIQGDGSSGRSTQVTFTAETWEHIHKVMEEKHPGKKIIGWYHTHPGFGIFLSEMDLFIQRHFFNAAWQMAFVFDPKGHDAGMFAWRQGQVRRIDFVVDDENVPGIPSASALAATGPSTSAVSASPTYHEEPSAPVNAATLEELVDRVRVLEGRVKWLLTGFAILVVVAIIWPLIVAVVMPAGRGSNPPPTDPSSPTVKPDSNFPVTPRK